jgi:hypothetical protein
MSRMSRLVSASLVAGLFAASGCTPAVDWTSPQYIASQMSVGSDQAFAEYTRLTREQQLEIAPTLVDLYNRNFRRERALQALLAAQAEAGRDVFRAALQESDTLAAVGARGLASIGDRESAALIARRLGEVTTSEAYPAFLEALQEIPTAEAGDVVAEILMRPAPRIGGVNTVRGGCTFLAKVEDPSDAVIDALVFGLVNFIPEPFEDALSECELGLMAHEGRSVPKLLAVLNGENTTVTTHLRNLRYRAIVGQLRAIAVLAHIANDAALVGITAFVSRPYEVPMIELRDMPVAEQQNWYDQSGQLFTQVAWLLAYHGGADALALARRLEATDAPESLLANFTDLFALSAGAEFGLRTAIHEVLGKIGEDADRELLWTRATSGTVSRGGNAFSIELRKNALHFLGRAARPGEFARYEALVAAQPENARVNYSLHRGYFVLAERCGDDVACYALAITDTSAVMADEAIQAGINQYSGAEANMMRNAFEANVRNAAVWQLAVRFGTNPAAGAALAANLGHPSAETRTAIGDALLVIDSVPADLGAQIDALIEAESQNRSPQARAYRHQLRVVKAARVAG